MDAAASSAGAGFFVAAEVATGAFEEAAGVLDAAGTDDAAGADSPEPSRPMHAKLIALTVAGLGTAASRVQSMST